MSLYKGIAILAGYALFAMVSLTSGMVQAGETGQVLVNAELRQDAFLDAPVAASVTANTPVEVLKRQGGWLQVKSSAGTGWVKMTAVKLSGNMAAGGDNGLGTLVNVAKSGRSGNTGITVATGVRGLGAEDLQHASPNPQAVKKLDSFPQGRQEAQRFANAGQLQSRQVNYLAESGGLGAGVSSFFGGSKK